MYRYGVAKLRVATFNLQAFITITLKLSHMPLFANAIVANVKPRAGKDIWEIDFVGQMVNFQLHSEPKGVYPSLSINFFAEARNPSCAL
jgi:hypothetical protein